MIIQTTGDASYYDKNSNKTLRKTGNVYIHFKQECLSAYDGNFGFPMVRCSADVKSLMNDALITSLTTYGVLFD